MLNEKRIYYLLDKKRKIIPLSAIESYGELNEYMQKDYPVYKEYLKEALNNQRVNNIAVSGYYGIGKSSILSVFEKEQAYDARWIHISMGDFHNASTENQTESESVSSDNKQDLEINLLKQIIVECKQEEIPYSSFKLVPSQGTEEESTKMRIVLSVFITVIILLSLMIPYISSIQISIILSLILVCVFVFGLGWLIHGLLPKLRFRQMIFKAGNAELLAESMQSDSYLEKYCFELVYVLETLARKNKNCVVVFEDMDRLEPNLCVDIFNKLREINYFVNRRLKNDNSKLNFIYVVHDKLLSYMKMEKFFDYIMPIIPVRNKMGYQSRNRIIKLEDILSKEFDDIKSAGVQEMIDIVRAEFTDFRMIYTCINDYRVFRDIEAIREGVDVDVLDPKLFSFIIYKNYCPEQYYEMCRSGQWSEDCLKQLPQELKFFSDLWKANLLTKDCLQYIGCELK